MINEKYRILIARLTDEFKALAPVEAIGLGGSLSSNEIDEYSDIDLYIFSDTIIPLSTRESIASKLGTRQADLNLTYWDLGDEWFDAETGIEIDIIYWDKTWITDQIEQVVFQHQAQTGYTTCFWNTLVNMEILFDRNDWLKELQNRSTITYPEELSRAIIIKNYPVLKEIIPSYYNQIKKAVHRNDLVSVNHRVAAFLASYFDIIFAVNHLANPGEKKLMPFILRYCTILPMDIEKNIQGVLSNCTDPAIITEMDQLLVNLDQMLSENKLIWLIR